ncbi:MAG: bifunctional tetrahydrofolate synthase/dihydrofolate synthase [Legionellales bacterium]|nr:bifunctional tetrahydrofolate synthase/dihydrofolate synthase [Legionellales bacterium]
MKTLQSWIDHIAHLHSKRIELSLDRILTVARQMDLLAFQCPVITVAGTNGKGSCVASLESIYSAAGYCVGAYTSPGLMSINERIRVNQQQVADDELLVAFDIVEQARSNVTLSFFEFFTLAALQIFQHSGLDVLILEVGMGGRLDAVNIINADVSIITSIGLDHTEFLGNDRYTIAREKAGIMRQGCPVISGDPNPPASISETANTVGADLLQINQDFRVECDDSNQIWGWHSMTQQYSHLPLPTVRLDNAACALQAVDSLQSVLPVTIETVRQGLRSIELPGRFEQHRLQGVPVILDVAHNPDAVKALVEQLSSIRSQKYHAVFACAEGKDIEGMVELLRPLVKRWYVAPMFPSFVTKKDAFIETSEPITDALTDQRCCYTLYPSVTEAFTQAIEDIQGFQDEAVLVCGSFKTVAEVKSSDVFEGELACMKT